MTDESPPKEPRKATDILLLIENKLDTVLALIQSQDLTNKILSNKLNDVIAQLNKQSKITVETIQTAPKPANFNQVLLADPERSIPISSESAIPMETTPQGFRRTSRPETFANDEAFPAYQDKSVPSNPIAMMPPPGRSMVPSEITAPQSAIKKVQTNVQSTNPKAQPLPPAQTPQGQIPVIQRVVDKNGKSIFLAEVIIIDKTSKKQTYKGSTKATGKWSTTLPIGVYMVKINKRESITKEKLESMQDIVVDGSLNKLELPTLIIK